jgi:hypothetical protein
MAHLDIRHVHAISSAMALYAAVFALKENQDLDNVTE